jgi:predicted metal-dependent enzyme (double-stranded beta helix superfamily)
MEQSKHWPNCSQSERAENLLFYEDPDYKFVINGLIKAPKSRTQIHDHAHNWTLYGVLDGHETIERYQRLDDGSKADYAEIRQTEKVQVGPGKVDLVAPYQIHAEESGAERTVAIIVRAEKAGGFLQGRYDPAAKKYWQGYGPKQLPYTLK